MMPELTFGSLFAGIGGFDLGFERAGMKCAWQVEIDDFCQKVLEKHWPGVDRHGDIRECGRHNLEPVDVIAGGFPCQPHSVAGKRRGKADDRNLWPEYLRIVQELQPTWVVGENVPGLIHTMLDETVSDLEGEGYEVQVFNIPACGFDAPHQRYRLFIVAHSASARSWRESGNSLHKEWGASAARGEGLQKTTRWKNGATIGNYKSTSEDVAHRSSQGLAQSRAGRELPQAEADTPAAIERGSGMGQNKGNVAHASSIHAQRLSNGQGEGELGRKGWWPTEPDVGRVAHGVSSRVDRLKGLGNAVVPRVAEFVGRGIVEVHNIMEDTRNE